MNKKITHSWSADQCVKCILKRRIHWLYGNKPLTIVYYSNDGINWFNKRPNCIP